ncbi:MAG: hypothetical protein ACRD3Q_18630 [Terriglobales bacterium]
MTPLDVNVSPGIAIYGSCLPPLSQPVTPLEEVVPGYGFQFQVCYGVVVDER